MITQKCSYFIFVSHLFFPLHEESDTVLKCPEWPKLTKTKISWVLAQSTVRIYPFVIPMSISLVNSFWRKRECTRLTIGLIEPEINNSIPRDMYLVYHDLFYILTVIMLKVDAESSLTNPEETGDTETSIPPWTRSLHPPCSYCSLIVSAVQIHKLLQKSAVLIQRWEKDPFLSPTRLRTTRDPNPRLSLTVSTVIQSWQLSDNNSIWFL